MNFSAYQILREINFSDVKYKNPNVLGQSFKLTIESLLRENEEVPVKVEAAIALQMMLSSQGETCKKFVQPQIRQITMELLEIIRQTENDDLTTVMQKIVCSYTEELIPVAVEMCTHLVTTFAQVCHQLAKHRQDIFTWENESLKGFFVYIFWGINEFSVWKQFSV